tara:strand:- start:1110 stop:1397 length:288 start_codon:yes stop_codon:yes gene_type:complete
MAFTEPAASINAMLNDFGVSCTSGGTTGKGVLNQPDQVLAGDFIMSTDYVLRAKTSDFGSLIAGASITVDSVGYTVREVRKLNDGTFCELSIQKT